MINKFIFSSILSLLSLYTSASQLGSGLALLSMDRSLCQAVLESNVTLCRNLLKRKTGSNLERPIAIAKQQLASARINRENGLRTYLAILMQIKKKHPQCTHHMLVQLIEAETHQYTSRLIRMKRRRLLSDKVKSIHSAMQEKIKHNKVFLEVDNENKKINRLKKCQEMLTLAATNPANSSYPNSNSVTQIAEHLSHLSM